jgi:nickel transport protein
MIWKAAIAMLFLVSGMAQAALPHGMEIFVSIEADNTIAGQATYSGSAVVAADVRITDLQGNLLLMLKTDADGKFRFQAPARIDMTIEVLHQGHRGVAQVLAVDLSAGEILQVADNSLQAQELSSLIDQAVAKRITPLQREIAELKSEIRFQDILGGLGYIAGIFGAAFYFLGRRKQGSGE